MDSKTSGLHKWDEVMKVQSESTVRTKNGQLVRIRPMDPEDAEKLIRFFQSLSRQSLYFRFFCPLKELSPELLLRLTRIDPDREIALLALQDTRAGGDVVGVARIIKENDLGDGEFSVIVCDERQGEGIGAALLERCLQNAKGQGYRHIWGLVLPQNRVMLSLGNKLGFQLERGPDATTYQLSIDFSQRVDHEQTLEPARH